MTKPDDSQITKPDNGHIIKPDDSGAIKSGNNRITKQDNSRTANSNYNRIIKRPLCLLSLDGGGIRGLSELIILEEIMTRIAAREGLTEIPIPADRFDMMGIICILLGRLRLSAAEAIKIYQDLAGTVFSQKNPIWKDGAFKSSELEKAIKNVVGSKLGRTDAKMLEYGAYSGQCRAFVCAVAASDVTHPAGPTLFRTYEVARNKGYNCEIWQAARATSAAPTIFERIKIGPTGSAIDYVDPGLGYNNPIKQVLAEARRVFGDDARAACLLSIGTGQAAPARFEKPGVLQRVLPTELIGVLKRIATDSEKTAAEMRQNYRKLPGIYHRLNVERGLGALCLDEWKRLGEVQLQTEKYMELETDHLDKIVDALSGPCKTLTRELGSLVPHISTAARIFHTNTPNRMVHHFVLRQSLLEDLTRRLFGQPGLSKAVLQGMGGSGKTQLALECCRHAEVTLGFMATLWIDASSPASIVQSYKDITSYISKKLPDGDDGTAAVCIVQNTLRDWKQRWLVVFDNYDDPTAFRKDPIDKYIPRGDKGSILFTSRHQDSQRLGHLIKVHTMTKTESIELLLHKPSNEISAVEAAQASQIASMLGCLPLALDQAAGYIRSRGLSMKDFIPEYNARKQVVLQEIPSQWEYGKKLIGSAGSEEQALCVFTTWEMSLDMIRGTERERRAKHRFLALVDCNLISERYFRVYCEAGNPQWMSFLMTGGEWDSYKLGDFLAECGKLSLLQVPDEPSPQAGGKRFSIHPLVSEWMKLRMKQTEREKSVMDMIRMLAKFLHIFDFIHLPFHIRQETFTHVDACVLNDKIFCDKTPDIGLKTSPELLSSFATVYLCESRWNEGVRLDEQALLAHERSKGIKHVETLKSAANLAFSNWHAGRYKAAEELFQRVLTGFEKKLGSEHPYIPRITTYLADIYTKQEQYKEAEGLYKLALAAPNNLNMQATERNLGICYCNLGRCDEAEAVFKRIIADQQMDIGEHLKRLMRNENLATRYWECGPATLCWEWAWRYGGRKLSREELTTYYAEMLQIENHLTQKALEDLERLRRNMADQNKPKSQSKN